MKSTEAAAKDRQSEDTAMSKIMQKRIRDREIWNRFFPRGPRTRSRFAPRDPLRPRGWLALAPKFGEVLRKDRDGSAEKGTMKKEKGRGEGTRGLKKKCSPLPPRHETCTCSPRTCTQIICGKFEDEGFERFRGRTRKTEPKTHAENFGNCAYIGKKKSDAKNALLLFAKQNSPI